MIAIAYDIQNDHMTWAIGARLRDRRARGEERLCRDRDELRAAPAEQVGCDCRR